MIRRPVEILLIEDSPGDVWLIREILLEGPVAKSINVVGNGEHALDYLYRRGSYAKATRPDLVLLDLNLPRRDGFEVLHEIKSNPELRSITVVVLTTSQSVSDVNSAYDLNANCYIVKPVDLEQFSAAIRGIEDFFMGLAVLPTHLPPVKGDASAAGSGSGAANTESNGAGSSGVSSLPRHSRTVRSRTRVFSSVVRLERRRNR